MRRNIFTNNEDWLDARRGKVTGSTLKDIVVKRGTGKKIGYYRLIADRIAIPRDPNESRIDRGHTLEADAIARLAKETGLPFVQVDNELWTREDDTSIAYSPDGYVPTNPIEIVAEVKCLDSAKHLEAFITREIPSEYIEQTRQAFAVNDDMKTLYFAMYDPSLPPTCDFFYITITREQVADEVAYLLDYQRQTLAEVSEWVDKLTFA
jgi:hypothetical protein